MVGREHRGRGQDRELAKQVDVHAALPLLAHECPLREASRVPQEKWYENSRLARRAPGIVSEADAATARSGPGTTLLLLQVRLLDLHVGLGLQGCEVRGHQLAADEIAHPRFGRLQLLLVR